MSTPFKASLELAAVEVVVSGRVQGVCYRAFTQEAAVELGLGGWVRNMPDGRVQAEIQGPRLQIEKLLERLRAGPPHAVVTDLNIIWKEAIQNPQRFVIVS
jgi:acylphosphatase